jgi:hypothetical protein
VNGELVARAAPLLRLAANDQAVAATSRHLGRGRKVPRCRGVFPQGLDWPADAARLEGGCHAGRTDGELVAAVAPAAHTARLI